MSVCSFDTVEEVLMWDRGEMDWKFKLVRRDKSREMEWQVVDEFYRKKER